MNPSTDSGGDSKSPNSDSRGVKLWQWALKSPGSQAGVAETWYFQTLRTHDCHAEFKIIQKCNIKPLSNFLIWENRFQSHLKNRGQRGSRQNFLRPDLHIELCNSLIAALPAGDFCFLWGKIRAWNDSYQCYHCTRSGTAFCFRRCTKLLLETHTFFFFFKLCYFPVLGSSLDKQQSCFGYTDVAGEWKECLHLNASQQWRIFSQF